MDTAVLTIGELWRHYERHVKPKLDWKMIYNHPSQDFVEATGKARAGCPNHHSGSGSSFNVSTDSLLWYCAGCDQGGNAVQYRYWCENDGNYPQGQDLIDEMRYLYKQAGVEFPTENLSPEEQRRHDECVLYQEQMLVAIRHCAELLHGGSAEAKQMRDYLTGRGLSDDFIIKNQWGLYPGYEVLKEVIRRETKKHPRRPFYGLTKYDDLSEPSVVSPWFDQYGSLQTIYLAWSASKQQQAEHKDRTGVLVDRKYALGNPKIKEGEGDAAQDVVLYRSKASPLYFDKAKNEKQITVVEGLFDAAVLQDRGFTNTVACVGAQLTNDQLETLRRNRVRQVILALDPDTGGHRGTISCIRRLEAAGISTYACSKNGTDDPDEFVIERGETAWQQHLDAALPGAMYVCIEPLYDRKNPRLGEHGEVIPSVHPGSGDREKELAIEKVGAELSRLPTKPTVRSKVIDFVAEHTGYKRSDVKTMLKTTADADNTMAGAGESATASETDGPPGMQWQAGSAKLIIDGLDLADVADAFLEEFMVDGCRSIQLRNGTWWQYRDGGYEEAPEPNVTLWLSERFRDLSNGVITCVERLVRSRCVLNSNEPVCWVGEPIKDWDLRACIPTKTGLLNPDTDELLPATPKLFCAGVPEVGYDPNAEDPQLWLDFLGQLWSDDHQSIEMLQEWMGYCMTPETKYQKMVLLLGPRRSGKGTISRVTSKLVGADRHAGIALSAFAGDRAASQMYGKYITTIEDGRMPPKHEHSRVVETMLNVVGEDQLMINQKYVKVFSARLATKIMLISNQMPAFYDSSGALPGRMLLLRLTQSFYGSEDHDLEAKLAGQLDGILLWALEGLKRLRKRGHFVQPTSTQDLHDALESMTSPISAFIEECCELGEGYSVGCTDLLRAYKDFREDSEGTASRATMKTLAIDLMAAQPGVKSRNLGSDGNRKKVFSGLRLREKDDDGGRLPLRC